jgi:hypothetical protein
MLRDQPSNIEFINTNVLVIPHREAAVEAEVMVKTVVEDRTC